MTTKSDLEFMLDIDLWPKWPYLPVKKTNPNGGFPITGVLVDATGAGILHPAYFFFETNPRQGSEQLRQGGRELVEELVNNGWVVD